MVPVYSFPHVNPLGIHLASFVTPVNSEPPCSEETIEWLAHVLGMSFVHGWMKCFGGWTPKPFKLLGTLPGLSDMRALV